MLATQSNSATMPLVQIDYKRKYKALKKKLKLLIYEHECFLEELGKAQRKLLKVNRDKSFLLDRLLLHEKPCDSSSESDLTGSSDSEAERDSNVRKRKLMPILAGSTNAASGSSNQASKLGVKHMEPLRKKARIIRKVAKGLQLGGRTISIQGAQLPTSHTNMTREELERHLEIKQSTRQLMSLSAAPSALPDDIFCNDDSNQDNEARVRSSSNVTALTPDHDHLVIDIPSKKQ